MLIDEWLLSKGKNINITHYIQIKKVIWKIESKKKKNQKKVLFSELSHLGDDVVISEKACQWRTLVFYSILSKRAFHNRTRYFSHDLDLRETLRRFQTSN